jgi:cobaltochelatase CobT
VTARKILVVFSDGPPIDDATLSVNRGSYLADHLKEAAKVVVSLPSTELVVIGVRYAPDTEARNVITVEDAETIGVTVLEILEKIVC